MVAGTTSAAGPLGGSRGAWIVALREASGTDAPRANPGRAAGPSGSRSGALPGQSVARLGLILTALAASIGASKLAACLGFVAPGGSLPTAVQLAVAVLWSAAALSLPGLGFGVGPGPTAPPKAGPTGRNASEKSLAARARVLEILVRDETWAFGKAEALRELRDVLDELETDSCKN